MSAFDPDAGATGELEPTDMQRVSQHGSELPHSFRVRLTEYHMGDVAGVTYTIPGTAVNADSSQPFPSTGARTRLPWQSDLPPGNAGT